ncbi:RNA polymerase sigma factor [Carnobacterium divergens]|uniref:RNA polymerase sigma factor n=1 Tax=Carnobacterium divergens TaxID=2748 RepID=UPI0039AF0CD1
MNTEKIYEEYGNFIFRYLLTLTKNEQIAEELTQETFYQALKSIDHFEYNGTAKFSTWLCQIAKNLWLQELNYVKNRNKLTESLIEKNPFSYDLEEKFLKNEEKIDFFKKAHQLNERQREILYLRLLGNLSFKEIGSVFGETENWARVTFYRVKQQMWKGDKNNGS